MKLDIKFAEKAKEIKIKFSDLCIVEKGDIPKEYGLITYTQDKIITIT